jgi:hypothetical protein
VLKPYNKASQSQRGKASSPQIDLTQSDVYSLGLVLLELSSIQTEKDFYKADLTVNKELIQAKLTDISGQYSNEFMEMVIRMLTIDPTNRITAEELVELTSLRATANDRSAITPRQQTSETSRDHTNHDVPQFSRGVPTHNIQFKQPNPVIEDGWGSSAVRKQNVTTFEQGLPQVGLQRSASGRNLFDPDILNRVNTNRIGSRAPERAREVSPAPPLPPQAPGNQTQRARLEGSGISNSRIRRGDPSKSPLRKVYGSNLENEGQVVEKPTHTQSMHNINVQNNMVQRDPALDSISVNLNNMFSQHQSERQIPQQMRPFQNPVPQGGFNSQQQGFSSGFAQGMSPLKLKYPLSSNQNTYSSSNLGFQTQSNHQPSAFIPLQNQVTPQPQLPTQEFSRREVSPIPTPRRDVGPTIITGSSISPISGRYAKVTRYSVDKNGQRTLIESGADIRVSNSTNMGGVQGSFHSKRESESNIMRGKFGENTAFGAAFAMPPLPVAHIGTPVGPLQIHHGHGPYHEQVSPRPFTPTIMNEPPRGVSPAPIAIRS